MTRLLRLAPLFLLALPAFAGDPPLEELKAKLQKQWDPWKDCEPGSWVQMATWTKSGTQENRSEMRQTLLARDAKGLTIESRTVKHVAADDGTETVEMGPPQTTTIPSTIASIEYEDLKDLRHEDVEVSGKKLDCRVVEMTYVYKYPQPINGQTEIRTKMRMWFSAEIRENSGIVKTESDTTGQAPMGASSSDMSLVEIGAELHVGGKTLVCSVYKYGNASNNEQYTSSGRLWMCKDVPTGYIKVEMTSSFGGNGASKTTMEMKTEITGMEIVKAKQE